MRHLIATILLLPAIVFAAQDTLQNRLAAIKTYQADFTQTVISQSGGTLQQSSGTVSVARPNTFRWDQAKPMQQTIVCDGQTVWQYEPDLAQVTIQKLNPDVAKMPILLLSSHQQDLGQNYQISEAKKAGKTWFTLVPQTENAMFQYVMLGFKNDALVAMRLMNNLGQTTMIQFSDIELNKHLSKKTFHLTWPKGTDVVKLKS